MNEQRALDEQGEQVGQVGQVGQDMAAGADAVAAQERLTECSEALLRVYEFLDGELGPEECAKIQAHLDACGPCLQEYDLDTTLKALIKRSCGSESAPDTLRLTIMSRISVTLVNTPRGDRTP